MVSFREGVSGILASAAVILCVIPFGLAFKALGDHWLSYPLILLLGVMPFAVWLGVFYFLTGGKRGTRKG